MAAFQNPGGRHHLAIAGALDVLTFARPAARDLRRPNAAFGNRLAELGVEIDSVIGLAVTVSPTPPCGRTVHPALDGVVVQPFAILSRGGPANAPGQVNLYARL